MFSYKNCFLKVSDHSFESLKFIKNYWPSCSGFPSFSPPQVSILLGRNGPGASCAFCSCLMPLQRLHTAGFLVATFLKLPKKNVFEFLNSLFDFRVGYRMLSYPWPCHLTSKSSNQAQLPMKCRPHLFPRTLPQ